MIKNQRGRRCIFIKDFVMINGKFVFFEEILDKVCCDSNDIVYISGSIVEGSMNVYSRGMGNDFSDIDVFILKDDDSYNSVDFEYDKKYKKIDFMSVKSIPLDIEFFKKSTIYYLKESLDCYDLISNERIGSNFILPNYFSIDGANSFINRLKNSICINNFHEYNMIRNDFSFNKWTELQKQLCLNSIDNLKIDVFGNLKNNQLDVAMYCTREMYFEFMKFIILINGDFVDRDKWIPLKFMNICSDLKKYSREREHFIILFYSDVTKDKKKLIVNTIDIIYSFINSYFLGDVCV